MSRKSLLLNQERNRRFWTMIVAALVTLIAFYEIPLYWFLKALILASNRYADVNQSSYDLESPEINVWQLLILGLILGYVVYVIANPRHYLQKTKNNGAEEIHLFLNSQIQDIFSLSALSILRIRTERNKYSHYIKLSRSWREYHSTSICIDAVCNPRVIFYDQKNLRKNKYLSVTSEIENYLGNVHWIDKEGLLGSNATVAKADQYINVRQKHTEDQIPYQPHHKSAIKTLSRARVLFATVFTIFGATFWFIGKYKIAGGIFFGIALIVLIDLILTMIGFCQQSTKGQAKK